MKKIFFLLLPCSLFLSLAQAELIERRAMDVTVLEAWVTDSMGEETEQRDGFNKDLCIMNDCTKAVELKTGVPLLNIFTYLDYHTICEMIEVRTVVPEEAFLASTFKGVGLYLASTDCGQRSRYDYGNSGFVSKEKMLVLGKTKLKDGRSAFILRFHAQGLCTGPMNHNFNFEQRHGLEFRPYVRFEDQGNEYRNWDYVSQDYKLGCVASDNNGPIIYNRFSRKDELLQ